MFAEKYVLSLTSSNLQDDEHHHHTDALAAAALADQAGAGIGSLLSRVKFADGSICKEFESGTVNLAQLLRVWTAAVTEKGRSRGWIKVNNAWDVSACHSLYRRVAERSLAHWLDGKCETCRGTGVTTERRFCTACKGTGRSEITGGGYEREKIMDMVSELEGLVQAHNARAAGLLRRG
jgi:hypothetical protein